MVTIMIPVIKKNSEKNEASCLTFMPTSRSSYNIIYLLFVFQSSSLIKPGCRSLQWPYISPSPASPRLGPASSHRSHRIPHHGGVAKPGNCAGLKIQSRRGLRGRITSGAGGTIRTIIITFLTSSFLPKISFS